MSFFLFQSDSLSSYTLSPLHSLLSLTLFRFTSAADYISIFEQQHQRKHISMTMTRRKTTKKEDGEEEKKRGITKE